MQKEKSIEEMIYEETKKRLDIMKSPDYVFPKRIATVDVAGIIGGVGISVVLILFCMLGVIK